MGKTISVGLATLFFFNFLAWTAVFHYLDCEPLKVVFFDVGQGDAIFIEVKGLYQILIDGGPGRKVLEKLSQEMPFWDKTIDLVILTHPEKDHLEGLIEVLDKYQIGYVLWTGVLRETAVFEQWEKALEKEIKEGATIKIAKRGQKVSFKNALIEILHPLENLEKTSPKNSNKSSIVAKLFFNQKSFLFTGDIYQSEEKKLIKVENDLEADVLKIAHHGSKTSSSEEFISVVLPEIAVIQAGENNSYGHPHEEVLARLERYGVRVLRTDKNGDIKIVSDGKKLEIR